MSIIQKRFSTPAARYGLAILLSAFALVLSRTLTSFVESKSSNLFLGAVVATACFAGLGPALLATACSILAVDYFILPPIDAFSLGATDLVDLTVFGFVSVLTSSLSARLKAALASLQAATDDLEKQVLERTAGLNRSNQHLRTEIAQRKAAEEEILQTSTREQQRLGQDLHDGLCQILAGTKLACDALRERLDSEQRPEAEEAARIERQLGEALAQADIVSRGLYPVALETGGLSLALGDFAQRIPALFPVTCIYRCPRPIEIGDAAIATHVYRIAREAVINAIKGGRATRVIVRLTARDSLGIISVMDNGVGLGTKALRKGMGIKIMEYRARVIGGQLSFRSRSKGCTRMRCTFQVEPIGGDYADEK